MLGWEEAGEFFANYDARREGFRNPKRPELDPCPQEGEGTREDYALTLDSDGAEFK